MKAPELLVKEHWKEFHPEKYRRLKEAGTLEKEALIIRAKVADMITELTDEAVGMNWEEARHQAYQELIFTEPEPSVREKWEQEEQTGQEE